MTNEEHRSGGMGMRTREMEMRNGTWGMGVEEQEAGKLDEGTWRMDEERRIWNEEVGTRNMKLRNEGRSYNERRVKKKLWKGGGEGKKSNEEYEEGGERGQGMKRRKRKGKEGKWPYKRFSKSRL